MKIIYSILFLIATGNFFVAAQDTTFQKIIGGPGDENAFDVIVTTDGGYAAVGTTSSYGAGDLDVLLVKLDSAGNIQWSHAYGGVGSDQGMSLVQAGDGGFALCGKTSSYGQGDFDFMLIKTDSIGTEQWTKAYGGPLAERVLNILQTSDHGFILSGATQSYGQGNWDMLFIKTDSVGDTLWTKIMGGLNYDQGTDADQATGGGYIFSGRTSSWGSGSNDVYLARTDPNGDTLWTRVFGGTNWDEGMKVRQTTDGGYIVTGAATSFTNGGYDVYLNKVDSAGHLTWSKLYAGVNTDATYDVLQLADGGYIVTGETESFGINHHPRLAHHRSANRNIQQVNHTLGTDYSNVLAIRTDVNGDTLWTRTYGGSRMDEALSIIQTPDGGFMIAAVSISFGNDSTQFYLIKTDSSGFTDCNTGYANPVVSTPPTVEMNTATQIISGVVVTNVPAGTTFSAPVVQSDPCPVISGMKTILPSENIFVYPNPCSSLVTFSIPPEYRKYTHAEIFVHDMYGRIVKEYHVEYKDVLQLPVSEIACGMYEVKMVLTCNNEAEQISAVIKLAVK